MSGVFRYETNSGDVRWGYRFDVVGGRDGRRQIKRQGFTLKREAEDALDAARIEHAGVTVRSDDELLPFLLRWVEHRRRVEAIKPGTADSYLTSITSARVLLADRPLDRVTAGDLDDIYAEMTRTGGNSRKGRSPRTIRLLHTVIRRALDDAVRRGLLARNPADAAIPPSAKAAQADERKVWPADAGAAFLEWDDLPENRRAAWALILGGGLRRGELAGLRWDDIDGDTVQVSRIRYTQRSGETIEADPKTARAKRRVTLSPPTLARVERWRTLQAEQFLSVGLGGGGVYVFTNRMLKPTPPSDISKRWASDVASAVKAGVVPFAMTLHDGRHWHATQLVAAGVDLRTVADRLGHADPGFTLKTYSHSDLDRDRAASARLAI